jgi:hypothetical protein
MTGVPQGRVADRHTATGAADDPAMTDVDHPGGMTGVVLEDHLAETIAVALIGAMVAAAANR